MREDMYKTSLANFPSTCPLTEGIVLFLNLKLTQKVLAMGQRFIPCLHVWGGRRLV